MMTQVHQNYPFLTIHWDEGNDCVWMEWKQFVKGKEFREGLDEGLGLLKEKGATRWLADTRKLSVLDMEDQDWTIVHWFPRAIRAGLERMAIVRPTKAVAMMSVNDVMRKADLRGLAVAYFDSLEDARAWIRQPRVEDSPPASQDRP